jgi:hypothetical protein
MFMTTNIASQLAQISTHSYTLPEEKKSKPAVSIAAPQPQETVTAKEDKPGRPAGSATALRILNNYRKQAQESIGKTIDQAVEQMKESVEKKIDSLHYKTGSEFFVADLNDVRQQAPELYQKTLPKLGRQLHKEFHDCDDDCVTTESATAAAKTRIEEPQTNYAKTLVTYRLKTSRLSGNTSAGLVSTVAIRKYDNPDFDGKYGEGWLTDLITRRKFRGEGHGKRIDLVAVSEADKHREVLDGKVRLYTEEQNLDMHTNWGSEEIGRETITDDKNEPLDVTIMAMTTEGAKAKLNELGVTEKTAKSTNAASTG